LKGVLKNQVVRSSSRNSEKKKQRGVIEGTQSETGRVVREKRQKKQNFFCRLPSQDDYTNNGG
jgi:hypothetical protein